MRRQPHGTDCHVAHHAAGVEPYTRAVATLFDPAESRADLVDIAVTDSQTITLHWRLEGKLRLGGLRIKPYTGRSHVQATAQHTCQKHLTAPNGSEVVVEVEA